jgi:hypothetical protein
MFSLVNAPVAFQGLINNMLCKHLDPFCTAYLDNIDFHLNFLEEHREHIRLILTKLQKAGLYLKLLKCKFKMKWIRFVSSIAIH